MDAGKNLLQQCAECLAHEPHRKEMQDIEATLIRDPKYMIWHEPSMELKIHHMLDSCNIDGEAALKELGIGTILAAALVKLNELGPPNRKSP